MADSAKKTSFIPKQTMGTLPKRASRRSHSFSIFNLITIVVFVGALIVSIGVFFYKDFTQSALDAKKQELVEFKQTFSNEDFQSIRELDRRISTAKSLLDAHLSPSVMFDALELNTQNVVQFTQFSYTQGGSGEVEVVLAGQAPRFNTIALQAQRFANTAVLPTAVFSELSISGGNDDEEGGGGEEIITFKVTDTASREALAYTAFPVSSGFEGAGADSGVGSFGETETSTSTDGALEEDFSDIDDEFSEIDQLLDDI